MFELSPANYSVANEYQIQPREIVFSNTKGN